MCNLVMIRTHYIDSNLLTWIDRLRREIQGDIVVVADERKHKLDFPEDLKKLSLTDEWIESNGLYNCSDIAWRAGDYNFYLAHNNFPNYKYYLMLEHDVRLHFASMNDFLDLIQDCKADLLAPLYRKSELWWPWVRRMVPFSHPVYRCLFPCVRLSSRAIKFLLAERQRLSTKFLDSNIDNSSEDDWPNDESFVATTLTNNGYNCQDFNNSERKLYSELRFSLDENPIAGSQLSIEKPSREICHPVLHGPSYCSKIMMLLKRARNQEIDVDIVQKKFGSVVAQSILLEGGESQRKLFESEYHNTIKYLSVPFSRKPVNYSKHTGSVCTWHINDVPVRFFVKNERDYISRSHIDGRFYEELGLFLIYKYSQPGMIIVDIGSHVGNHTVFFATFLSPREIIPIEPNLEAVEIFEINAKLNGIEDVINKSFLRKAFGLSPGRGIVRFESWNTGAAYVDNSGGGQGSIEYITAEDISSVDHVSLIKIDINGSEVSLLIRLIDLIRKCKPIIWASIPDRDVSKFQDFTHSISYRIEESYCLHTGSSTFIIKPV